MEKNNKVCLTTFVYGEKYQDYIPLLIYSCNKSYPEYDIILFLYDDLRNDIRLILNECGLLSNKVIIKEQQYHLTSNMTPLIAKALRWVLWDDLFNDYDYLYVVDIDMLYVRENIPLHIQHINHMNVIDLPFSNMLRKVTIKSHSITSILQRIKHANLIGICKFIQRNNTTEYKVTGLHFIAIKPYYSLLNEQKRSEIINDIISGKIYNKVMTPNNEVMLWIIIKDYLKLNTTNMGVQSSPLKSLDYEKYMFKEFRPHHGIHLGIFRAQKNIYSDPILESKIYKEYVTIVRNEYIHDEIFRKIYHMSSDNIKHHIDALNEYYKILM